MLSEIVLQISHLNSFYGKGKRRHQILKDVSLELHEGEVLGIVGESGSGKSTLAKCILGMVTDTEGQLILRAQRPQMVFQDPYGSLNPAKTVGWILEEPLRVIGVRDSYFAADEKEMRSFCDVYIESFEELLLPPKKR